MCAIEFEMESDDRWIAEIGELPGVVDISTISFAAA
jgi:hypothetical protein